MPGKIQTYILLLFLLCQFGTACQTPDALDIKKQQYIDTLSASLHAVEDARLREVMSEFNSLMFEQMYTELELDQQRRLKARSIARAAANLNRTVGELPKILFNLQLTPDEQDIFRGLAADLQDQAQVLEKRAESGDMEALKPMIYRMNATCNACHSLFRGPRANRKRSGTQ